MPCGECGDSVERRRLTQHRCDPERLVDFAMFGLRHEVAQLEARMRRYLDTPRGRFDVWLAARQVRA
jgi:hypothetical protein